MSSHYCEIANGEDYLHHGVPGEILSDHGATFPSGLLREMYKMLDIHKVNTTTYNPQADGFVDSMYIATKHG